jgi:hypothetical protein
MAGSLVHAGILTMPGWEQLGLLPQVNRNESDIYANIKLLLKAARRPVPPLENMPTRYLTPAA